MTTWLGNGKMKGGRDVRVLDNGKIGSFIRELRKEKGLTQKDLADVLHITDRAVSKWERGLNAPDIALLEPLSEMLEVSVGELILGERAEQPKPDGKEAKDILDYSKNEIFRKVGNVRKKYLGLLGGILALVLLLGGAILWRSGIFFLLDKKVSPDGQSVIRVYSKGWDFWPLHFTLEDKVQTVGKISKRLGGGELYVGYGSPDWPVTYEGLWWAPDSERYVIAFRDEEKLWLELGDLVYNNGTNLTAVLNIGWHLEQMGLLERGGAEKVGAGVEYQFLQWGKDSGSMLFYYSFDWKGLHEGYFWYDHKTGQVNGIVEL